MKFERRSATGAATLRLQEGIQSVEASIKEVDRADEVGSPSVFLCISCSKVFPTAWPLASCEQKALLPHSASICFFSHTS